MKDAQVKIKDAVSQWDGVTVHPHRFGGIEFRLGRRELGHVHGNSLLDIPFPIDVRNDLVNQNRAEPHHILPQSGWVSFYIRTEKDIDVAIELLQLSFEIASKRKKITEPSAISNNQNHQSFTASK